MCIGDSGGPLMLRDSDTGKWSVVGVTFFGPPENCRLQGVPDVFARVELYLDFILEHLN